VLATVVDTKELWQTVVASAVAGVGITLTFSLMILGVARSADRARDERPVAAAGAGLLAVTALLLTVVGVALAMVVMLSK
jgi:hypothetical protein